MNSGAKNKLKILTSTATFSFMLSHANCSQVVCCVQQIIDFGFLSRLKLSTFLVPDPQQPQETSIKPSIRLPLCNNEKSCARYLGVWTECTEACFSDLITQVIGSRQCLFRRIRLKELELRMKRTKPRDKGGPRYFICITYQSL